MTKRWQISRRTLLKGAGAALALPLLEAMGLSRVVAAEAPKAPVRMAFLYMPNGVNPHTWTPATEGAAFELTPALTSLAKVKDKLLILSELQNANSFDGEGHYVKTACFLTGAPIYKTAGADLHNGVSVDQLAAQKIGRHTALSSLELGVDPVRTAVDMGYTTVYGSHISWRTPTTPSAKEINPQLAFDRLFRTNKRPVTEADPLAPKKKDDGAYEHDGKSVLDLVSEDAKNLRGRVGRTDQRKLDEYLDSVREMERRIATVDKDQGNNWLPKTKPEKLERPDNSYAKDITKHARLMLDMMVLAFQTDSTRVGTFMFGNAVSGRNFSFLEGVKGSHHEISHHENNPAKMEEYRRINAWHVAQYAYMLEKMNAIDEGDGRTLLDNSMIVFGSGLRDGNAHSPKNLPILLAGGGGGTLKTGRHLRFAKETPLCNLYVEMLKRAGAPVKEFGDSNGGLSLA